MNATEFIFNEAEIAASCCRESFEFFVREFWELVPSSQPLIWNWHMTVLCEEMQKGAERVFAGLPCEYDAIFNVPFGTSKSSICTILFQPWTWTRMPQARHLTATHTEPLGADLASKSLAVILSEKYQEYFPEIVMVKKSDSHFTNTMGGDRRISTVGGKTPMGFHAHFLGVDDPLDPKGAMSLAEVENAALFMTRTLPSRKVTPKINAWTYLVMQRVGRGDPTDVMMEESKKEGAMPVRQIVLPGELSDDVRPIELKEKYVDGLLDPRLLPQKVLAVYRAKGPHFYSSQVQQNPLALGGGMFKRTYFNQIVKAAPYDARRIRYYDRASTQDGGCYTAGVLLSWGMDQNWYVEHVVHGQWEPDERNRVMRATALKDRRRYGPKYEPRIYVEEEGGSSGRDAWKSVVRALAGFAVFEDKVSGSKDARAEPWSAQCAALNVYLVDDGTWDVEGYIVEHILFKPEPGKRLGKFKDQVDASSGAFNLHVGSKQPGTIRVYSLGGQKKSKTLRLVVCSQEALANTVIEDHPCLLVSYCDPLPVQRNGPPPHGLNLLEHLWLPVPDMDSQDYQGAWEEPVAPYGKPPSELVMHRGDGKKLWSFLLKKRDKNPEVVVLQDDGDRRALSTAMGIADALRIPRSAIYEVERPEKDGQGTAPNPHVYATVKSTRETVM